MSAALRPSRPRPYGAAWREKVMRGNARALYGLPPAERPGGEELLAGAPAA